MNWMMPEPASDIRAQAAALLDPRHPKDAMFVVPANGRDMPLLPGALLIVESPEGYLFTTSPAKRDAFMAGSGEAAMAAILGYPEPKDAAMASGESLWIVQARNWPDGSVITEALASRGWVGRTREALMPHGHLVVLTPDLAISRRINLRLREIG